MAPLTNAGVLARCLAETPAALVAQREAESVENIERYLEARG